MKSWVSSALEEASVQSFHSKEFSSPFLLPAYPIAAWYLSDFHSWQRLCWDNPLYVQWLVSPQSFQCCINSCHSLILFLYSPTSAWISSISVSTEAFFFFALLIIFVFLFRTWKSYRTTQVRFVYTHNVAIEEIWRNWRNITVNAAMQDH